MHNILQWSGLFVSTLKIFYEKFAIFLQISPQAEFSNGSNHRIIKQKIDQIYIQNTIVIVPRFPDIVPDDDFGE
jgi:hypothetical protein